MSPKGRPEGEQAPKRVSAEGVPLNSRIAWHDAGSVLAVRLDGMGDLLMTTPALRALKEGMPSRRLALLTSAQGVCVLMRQKLHELPALVQLAHDEGMDEVFVQYLCHDLEEPSLPPGYTAMRDFVRDQVLDSMPREVVAAAFEAARAAARARPACGCACRRSNAVRAHDRCRAATGRGAAHT